MAMATAVDLEGDLDLEVIEGLDLELEAIEEEGVDVLERACLDVDAPTKSFCRLYKVHDGSRKVVGVSHIPSQASPAAAFKDHPCLNVDFALGSVFRGRKKADATLHYFTCFTLSPRISKQGKVYVVCVTAGHCYGSEAEYVEGCFGSTATDKDFDGGGFPCPTIPLHLWRTSKTDIALFELAVDELPNVSFLLPCSSDPNATVAEFGYPCSVSYLRKAKEELVDDKVDHGVWRAYRDVVQTDSKQELYDMLWDTFSCFRSGDLLCSPGRVTEIGENLQLRTSTLPGNTGGPVIPSWVEAQGYFMGIHRSGAEEGDLNFATSTDAPAFVEYYQRSVLPYLPGPDDVLWTGRDMGPFVKWLQKHQLYTRWEAAPVTKRQRQQPFKSLSVGSSELGSAFT